MGVGMVAAGTTFTPGPPPAAMVAGALDVAETPTVVPTATATPAATIAVVGRSAVVAPAPAPTEPSDALPPSPPPPDTLTGYHWPLPRGRITLPFGPWPWGSRIVNGEASHDGIDMATSCGDRIVAAHDGTVLAAGRKFDDVIGWIGDLSAYYRRLEAKKLWSTLPIVVVIDDGNGYRSIYAHLSRVVVKQGQTVRAGALLGYEGQTGRASGCHLHYGLFSPYERALFAIDVAVVKRMKVPAAEIARIDPLLVLPARATPTRMPAPSPSTTP